MTTGHTTSFTITCREERKEEDKWIMSTKNTITKLYN